MTLAR